MIFLYVNDDVRCVTSHQAGVLTFVMFSGWKYVIQLIDALNQKFWLEYLIQNSSFFFLLTTGYISPLWVKASYTKCVKKCFESEIRASWFQGEPKVQPAWIQNVHYFYNFLALSSLIGLLILKLERFQNHLLDLLNAPFLIEFDLPSPLANCLRIFFSLRCRLFLIKGWGL